MNKSSKRKKILIIIFILIITLFVGGISYAFFTANTSNTNNQTAQIDTGDMVLVFSDNDNGISASLSPGESVTKKFTLENTGSLDASAKINWYNLVNTYTANSLSWVLEQSTSVNGTYTTIGSGKVPTSSSATTAVLKKDILVPEGTLYYYKLTITLNNLDVEQDSDKNASFYSYFNLESGRLNGAQKIQSLVADANPSSTNVITKTAPEGANCTNTLAYDGTTDNNLRYVGANPCNYVTFNGETAGWRIIGVMNNIDDGTGNKETRIKLIRKDSLGKYAWDSSESRINSGYGINDWTQADLKNELNGDYLDLNLQADTTWYNGDSNKKTATFNITKRLSIVAQSLIGDAKWYLGGTNTVSSTARQFYSYERGSKVWGSTSNQTCKDGYCPRNLDWKGKVALIYPSDYGYAVGGIVRTTCLGTNLNTYSSDNCSTNNWLSLSSAQWFLSPYSSIANYAFYADSANEVSINMLAFSGTVRPAVYLKSEVTISGGTGTESDPFILG